MRFRSDTPVRVVSENGVHSAIIGTEFQELPVTLHQVALQTTGVEFDKTSGKVKEVAQQAADPNAFNQTGEDGVIRKAIEGLLTANKDEDFTSEGRPRVDSINLATGANHTKDDVSRVWDLMAAEAAAAKAAAEEPKAKAETEAVAPKADKAPKAKK